MYTKVFENKMLRGPELTGGWRNFRNKKLHDLSKSSNIEVRWMMNVACVGDKTNVCRVLAEV
jgi:hypothetical protein